MTALIKQQFSSKPPTSRWPKFALTKSVKQIPMERLLYNSHQKWWKISWIKNARNAPATARVIAVWLRAKELLFFWGGRVESWPRCAVGLFRLRLRLLSRTAFRGSVWFCDWHGAFLPELARRARNSKMEIMCLLLILVGVLFEVNFCAMFYFICALLRVKLAAAVAVMVIAGLRGGSFREWKMGFMAR